MCNRVEEREFEYYKNYIEYCWKQNQHWRNEVYKMLYWIGTVFTLIVTSTVLFEDKLSFSDLNIESKIALNVFFHVLFLIGWLFLLYQKLNALIFEKIALAGECYLNKRYLKNSFPATEDKPPYISNIQNKYLGIPASFPGGRGRLLQSAGWLIIVLYLCLVAVPFRGAIKANIPILITSIPLFVIFALLSWLYFKRKRDSIEKRIKDNWQSLQEIDDNHT